MSEGRIYLFKRFERFWHWSQALLVITMLYTGFAIHGYLPMSGFRGTLLLHEAAAVLLVTLWVFAIFWHFTTGEWKQYIPTLDKVGTIARYYAFGMFRGESHPYEVTPERKHNPLQRLAYLGLKLVINPLIWFSGTLLLLFAWNAIDTMPLGLDLRGVALLHTAAAYLMLAFFIAHVYLATTGHTPLSYIRAMVTGWEDADDAHGARS
jgi:thiosulfate reductase cytochrome b subunit